MHITSITFWPQARREGEVEGGLATPGPAKFGGPAVAQKYKIYARMYHFKKKNSKHFSPEGPLENVWRPRENVSPGPAVTLDRPVWPTLYTKERV